MVVESSGHFTGREESSAHVKAGAKRVMITAPSKDADVTLVMGVNETAYDPKAHVIISNASCTTNCLAPVADVLLRSFGILHGCMTTIHSYTNDQPSLDFPHQDLRRARASALSMIPTSTGAAKALPLVLPELKGKMDGVAIRVPTPNVSLIDLPVEVERDCTEEGVNAAFLDASENRRQGILKYSTAAVVSIDHNGDPHSAIVDAPLTAVVDKRLVKVFAWYDNEWAYACRVLDRIRFMASRSA